MGSILRLNRPCPCGSGQPYGECCAAQKKTRRKRKRAAKNKERRPVSTSSMLSGPVVDLDEATVEKLERFQGQFNDFYQGFVDAYAQCVAFEEETGGESFINRAMLHLETMPPDPRLEPGLGLLLSSYALFGVPDKPAHRRDRTHFVEQTAGEAAARSLAKMGDASLGVWRVEGPERDPVAARATRIDGQHPPTRVDALAVVDHQLRHLSTGVYLGWWLEFDDYSALFSCVSLDKMQLKKLEKAAKRGAWGSGEAFRLDDYQDDLTALLLAPASIDTGGETGRVFLNEIVHDRWSLDADDLFNQVVDYIYFAGLDTTIEQASDLLWKHRNYWSYYPEELRPAVWSPSAARAVGDEFERVVDLLRDYRADGVSAYVYNEVPVGPHSLEYLLPLNRMLTLIGLEADGSVDHPTADGALNFPLAVLDLDTSTLRRANFDPAWSIQQARAWASKQRLPADLLEQLDQAVEAHRIACRWAGIVARNEHRDEALQVHYDDLVAGIRQLLPTEAKHTPLAELDDPGRGTWTRIEKRLRAAGELDDAEALTLARLPAHLDELVSLDGVGDGSAEHLRNALAAYVGEWPASAGHLPATRSPAEADAAAGELHSGLDELDALF